MSQDHVSLDALRRDIDRIDDRIHDLIMERASLVGRIAAAKAPGDGIALRPAREAQVVRRLLGRHSGPFPAAALVRIWREIMGALVGLQAPFSIAVHQPERGAGYIELARDHFGIAWPMQVHPTPGQVVRAIADGQASVGVVPMPQPSDIDPWWLTLASDAANLPRIVARLPFLAGEELEAFVLACRPHDASGDDHSLVVVETSPDVSRDRVQALIAAAALDPTGLIVTHRSDDHWLHLVGIAGHVVQDDERLAALAGAKDPVRQVRVIGGYAVPVPA